MILIIIIMRSVGLTSEVKTIRMIRTQLSDGRAPALAVDVQMVDSGFSFKK